MNNKEQKEYKQYCNTVKEFGATPRDFNDYKILDKRLKMKKITKATFKSFLKKNEGKLFIQTKASFDGMSDCVEYIPSKQCRFTPLQKATVKDTDYQYALEQGHSREEIEAYVFSNKYTLGYKGIWLVNNSGDYFNAFDNGEFEGIEVDNCCGSYIIAIPKTER